MAMASVRAVVVYLALGAARAINIRGHLNGAAAIASGSVGSAADSEALAKNPIRKVVNLLEGMAKKVEAEGDEEEELYKKFSCYCQTGGSELQMSIDSNNAEIPATQSDIESSESNVLKLQEDLKQHQIDRDAANTAMQEATALREKENAKYVETFTELKEYVDALAQAVPAIEQGMAGTGFLQRASAVAAVRKAVANDMQLTEDDKSSVVAFLSGTSSGNSKYVPGSGEILGILKNMQEDFEKDLASVKATEEEAQKLYDDLMAAKTKEAKTLGASIEKKTARVGELQVEIVHMKQSLTEAEAQLVADQKFLADLSKNCETKKKEWEERQKIRSEELVAIHETIKILNDDDALDLFKKTLPSSSFVQLVDSNSGIRRRALSTLRASRAKAVEQRPELHFLEVALRGGKVDFSKVIKMIDDMVALLAQEQADDDHKREYCEKQIDLVEDKAKDLQKVVEDSELSIEDQTETIASLAEEIKTLKAEIDELDKLVMEATEQRKKENVEFTQLMSDNTQAKELLEFAKNRLNKFYNPTVYEEPPKTEDGEAPAAFLQRSSRHSHAADPGAAPETWGGYKKKSGETSSVVSMIDLLVRDLTREMTVAETDEENAQKEYEGFMQDSAGKRAKSIKAIGIKESAKADSEAVKLAHEGDLKVSQDKLMATKTYEQQLHVECDWLVQNYDLRKTARSDEMDNLKNAKAVLKGADFSLAQRRAS